MKKDLTLLKKIIPFIIFVGIFAGPVYSEKSEEKRNTFLIGEGIHFEFRVADRVLHEINFHDRLSLPVRVRPVTVLGWHFNPLEIFQIEFIGEFSFTKSDVDTVADFNTMKKYKAGGLNLNFHLKKQLNRDVTFWGGAGGGLLISSLTAENNSAGEGGFKIRNIVPVFNAEAGVELPIHSKFDVGLSYFFRIWKPTEFIDNRDLAINGITYKEINYSQGIMVRILFGRN